MRLLKNSSYYEKRCWHIVSEMETEKRIEGLKLKAVELLDSLLWWALANDGFCFGKMLEILLSQNFAPGYLEVGANEIRLRYSSCAQYIDEMDDHVKKMIEESLATKRNVIQKMFRAQTKKELRGELVYRDVAADLEWFKGKRRMGDSICRKIEDLANVHNNGLEIACVNGDTYVRLGA